MPASIKNTLWFKLTALFLPSTSCVQSCSSSSILSASSFIFFIAWRRWRELPHKLEEIPKQDLNGTLKRFFAKVRKSNSSEYKPDSLRTILAALDRHLRQAGAKLSIIKDREFDGSRKTLNGRAIVLHEGGLGSKQFTHVFVDFVVFLSSFSP